MKKLLWTSAVALTAVACLTACDDSSSGASNSIPTYKTESALPDSCEMEVAKAGDTYFACFENKWVEVTDSATVEKIKEGLDEKELKEQLEELEEKLEEAAAATKKSSSSKKVASSADADEGDVTPESSASEEECTGRRCGTGNSSSSKKSSGGSGNGGSGSEEPTSTESSSPSSAESSSPSSAESSSPSSAESSSPSSAESSSPSSAESSSPSSAETSSPSSSAGTSSPSSAETSSPSSGTSTETCGTATYNPETHFCRPRDNAVIAIADAGCCDDGRTCRYYSYTDYPNTYYDRNKEFCDNRTGADYRIYKMVTIGTQTWMAENLNYATAEGSYCYSGLSSNCEKYGRLYTWDVAVDNACPTGWHLPTHDEILELFDEVGSAEPLHVSGTSGFDLLLAGKYTSSSFSSLNTWTCLWTATEATTSTSAHCPGFNSSSSLYPKETQAKTGAFSVRCLKD